MEQPEQQIDLARAKLTIDRTIDPSIDIEANIQRLDHMVVRELSGNATSLDKLKALHEYLYQDSAWNGNQGFRYDFNDPLGQDIRNKLLPTYLATKRGNCVSMFFFIALRQKLGIDVTAALAPAHVFVKYRDKSGKLNNVEATNQGAFKNDAGYQRDILMIETLMQAYAAQSNQQEQNQKKGVE